MQMQQDTRIKFLSRFFLAVLIVALTTLSPPPVQAAPPVQDTQSDTWALPAPVPAMASSAPVPVGPRANRTVGIFYFLWQSGAGDGKTAPFDITRILAANPGNPAWGPRHAFHFWGEPQFGYYAIEDPWILRKHAQMLTDAGVDMLFLDATNAITYPDAYLALCRVYTQMRQEGNRTPQIAFILHSSEGATAAKLYNEFYGKNLYPELWFRWQGKPLILCDPTTLTPELRDFFTVRHSWAWSDAGGWFGDGRDKWSWLDNWPQKAGWHNSPSVPEEVPVAVAGHPTSNLGRSHLNGKQPAPGQEQSDRGLYFGQQWKRAREIDPSLIFVTGWNEWVAQRFVNGPDGTPVFLGKPGVPGQSYFVDEYSPEFSRDLEPMRGGWGDGYYTRLVEEVRRYKGVRAVPKPLAPHALTGNFQNYDNVEPVYRDDVGDTAHRDFHGFGGWGHYVNTSGRNDIVVAKVVYDKANLAFYVRTRAPLTKPNLTSEWMTLLLDMDGGGWQGFRFAVRRGLWNGNTRTILYRFEGEGLVPIKPVSMSLSYSGNEMQVIIPPRLLNISASLPLRFGFKWVDNCPITGDGTAFLDQGDAAPNGRFRYRFEE